MCEVSEFFHGSILHGCPPRGKRTGEEFVLWKRTAQWSRRLNPNGMKMRDTFSNGPYSADETAYLNLFAKATSAMSNMLNGFLLFGSSWQVCENGPIKSGFSSSSSSSSSSTTDEQREMGCVGRWVIAKDQY